ncbi:hypothetical protein [Flavobacterium sp.]|uniref:hypothetical protein n=1 Tax=Flavobacterium sp. TaxID=239 RepID=UPI0038FD2DD4
MSKYENKVLDSLQYLPSHQNIKSINDEIKNVAQTLSKKGYLECQFIENKKVNDATYIAKFDLGDRTNTIHIYIGKNKAIQNEFLKQQNEIVGLLELANGKDTLKIPIVELESFLNQATQKLEQQGFAFAKLKLIHLRSQNKVLYSELQYDLGKARILNSIIVKYNNSDKKNSLPNGHLTQMNLKYKNKIFNKKVVNTIYEDFEKFRFVSQVKYPEILFTKDTTKVYIYLDKRKSNTFDGFIGFANNNNNKIRFNGYLDITLENALKSGEQFSFYWKSNGNDQKTFISGIEIPYLFKSPLSLKAKINIFKQDSTFQNTKTALGLGYYIDYNSRIYLEYQETESSDIQNTNNTTLSDYKNSFITSNFEYLKFDFKNSNFPVKSKLSINFGIGKRTNNDLNTAPISIKQFYINLQASHNFYLNPKNCINIKYHNYFLKSDTYIINELFRFGGINAIRGFTENNFQANFMTAIQSEYRYVLSPSLYLHSILDFCSFEDDSLNTKNDLIGIGLGMGVNTKSGLLKLAFVNGITKNQAIKSYNTLFHVSYNVEF